MSEVPTITQDSDEEFEDDTNQQKKTSEDCFKILDDIRKRDRPKTFEKESNSMKHVNRFIKRHYKPIHEKNKITNCKDITYEFLQEEGNQFLAQLATYFATEAKYRGKDDGELLALNSVDGYFSSFKMYCIQKFEDKSAENLPCFQQMRWKSLRDGIISTKMNYAKKTGAKLVNSQDMADDDEVKTLATLCLWQGNERGVSFFAFNKLMYHLIARCSETAAFWKNDLSVVKKNYSYLF